MDELELTPQFRVEYFLDAIVNSTDCPYEARDRIELFLERIAGADIVTPEPMYRIEFYLAKIAGDDVEIPAPQHRAEFYLAAICGEEVELPEPHDRIDYWLYKWAEGGSLPWQTFVGNPLQFNALKAHTLRSTVVAFSPIQSGSGDPSPDNVRPISGWTGVDIYGAGENLCGSPYIYTTTIIFVAPVYIKAGEYTFSFGERENVTAIYVRKGATVGTTGEAYTYLYGTNKITFTADVDGYYFFQMYRGGTTPTWEESPITYAMLNLGSTALPYTPPTISTTTLSFGTTVYGGTAEVAEDGSVTVTIDREKKTITSWSGAWGATANGYAVYSNQTSKSINWTIALCNQFKKSYTGKDNMPLFSFLGGSGADGTWSFILPNTVTSLAEANAWLSNLETPLEIVSALATPVTYQLDPQTITALKGINTMWTDGDNLTVEAQAEAVNLNALQSLNMLLGGRYYNNGTSDEPTDEEALNILLGGNTK